MTLKLCWLWSDFNQFLTAKIKAQIFNFLSYFDLSSLLLIWVKNKKKLSENKIRMDLPEPWTEETLTLLPVLFDGKILSNPWTDGMKLSGFTINIKI